MKTPKTSAQLVLQCRRIKRKAQEILFNSEHPGLGISRPAARRAWRKANAVRNLLG